MGEEKPWVAGEDGYGRGWCDNFRRLHGKVSILGISPASLSIVREIRGS